MMPKLSFWRIFAIVILALLTLFMLMCSFNAVEEVRYYTAALEHMDDSEGDISSTKTEYVEGKDKIPTSAPFNKDCFFDLAYSYSGDEWLRAAKVLYDTTGIQLYRVYLKGAARDRETAKSICYEYIEMLPYIDSSIVVYEYIGDDYNSSIYETRYYGEDVLEYLSVADMEMISYIVDHDYDLFPAYGKRVQGVWELIGNNLKDGYSRIKYQGNYIGTTEWDRQYYLEEQQAYTTAAAVLFGITAVCFTGFVAMFYTNVILHPRKLRAEIQEQEARATKIILEADVKEMPDEADDLVDKYLK